MAERVGKLAVIPARGGSKRVPRKNVRLLAGVPMIGYTILAAVSSELFEQVMVSTDDPEIADVARSFGAAVPYLRGPELADDHTPVSAVSREALLYLERRGESFEHVCQLLPNCPLRDAEDIRASYDAFTSQPFDAQVSVTRYGWQNPWWAMERAADGAARPLFAAQLSMRSQDLPNLFCPTGAVWWSTSESLKRHGTFHVEPRALFELAWEKGVDIDDEADLELAEMLLARRAGREVPVR